MEIRIDLETVPPRVVLHEADEFKSFKVVVKAAEHARIPVAVLEQLAGARADDPTWRERLAKMLNYAQQHGFFDDRGIRAHIEMQRL